LIAFPILWLLSLLYRLILLLRAFFYKCGLIKTTKLPCPVISIGNITVGGTGKTPMTEYLAKYFAGKNKKVVVLSRGYGKIANKEIASPPDGHRGGRNDMLQKDDEGISVSSNLIIRLTGANRSKLGQEAIAKYSLRCSDTERPVSSGGVGAPDVILLDDGFQHWTVARDLNIVMIDCLNPFGNWCLLPAGILREPLSALKRADIFILAHTDLVTAEKLAQVIQYLSHLGKPVIKSIHKPIGFISPSEQTTSSNKMITTPSPPLIRGNLAEGSKSWAFCGIGNPDSFRLTLEKAGLSLVGFTAFPDHYQYKAEDIKRIESLAAKSGAECIVTTRKDMVKVVDCGAQLPLYALQIELVIIEGKEKLEEMLGRR